MNKNMLKVFLLTIFILFTCLSLVSASDISNDTTVSDNGVVSVESNVKTVDRNIIESDKLSDGEINYYVSDTSGSDTNQGTQSSPFKTIGTALNKTTSVGTYNIYIGAGTYKGVGNTNLTINGNNTINLIGDGINKTILDGEVNYSIISGENAWGSNTYWNNYNIQSGNWGLNITGGNGLITVSNMNIQNMVSTGGNSISGYKTATVDNYGNLSVNNVYFYNNLAGVGAGIRNNANSTLVVNNSVFEGNRKSSSTGNIGAGVYNNGTCTIINSNFTANIARWGTVTNDNELNISNSIFRDGISYDLGSTYKFGSAIASNTGNADFFNTYKLYVTTMINNCTFINNGQTDVYHGLGDLYVNNCNFVNSTGIYLERQNNSSIEHVINGSNFTNMQPSTLFGSLSTTIGTTFAIYDEGYYTIIENNTIEVNNNGYAIYMNSNSSIKNNIVNNQIYITGSNNSITENLVNTSFYYAIQTTNSSNNISNNELYSLILTGNNAVNDLKGNNIIENNIPDKGVLVNLTEENYNTYFDDDGIFRTNVVENKSIVLLSSDLSNKKMIFENTELLIRNVNTYKLINTSITIKEDAKVIIEGMIIDNTNTNNYTIFSESKTLIRDTQIYVNDTNPLKVVILNGDNTELRNIRITSYLPVSINNTIALMLNSSNNTFANITLNMYNVTNTGTGELIGILLNNTSNTQLDSITTNIISNSNATAIRILNSNEIILTSSRMITNATTGIRQIESYNTNNLDITTNVFNTNAQYVYGIILNNNNNARISITDAYFMDYYSQLQYATIPNFSLIGTYNLTAIQLNNTNNTLITSSSSRSRIQTNSTYTKAIETINSENTTIQYISFNNIAQNNRYSKIITSLDIKNSSNVYMNNINMSRSGTINSEGSLLILNNTNNTEIINNEVEGESQLKFIINITAIPIRLINANNNTINNLSINTSQDAITLTNSNNNHIINNNINTIKNSSITLTNSNNNNLSTNYINANDENGGNLAIITTDSQNNTLENNTPLIVYLNDNNYNSYFTNQTLNPEILIVILDSNIYNKNMTFNNSVSIKNPNNYTIYNTTLLSNNSITLDNININTTDDRINIINTNGTLTMKNTFIYHENKNNYAQTIYTTDYIRINDTDITTIAPEKQDQTNTIITTTSYYTIYRVNFNLTTNNNVNGTITGINGTSISGNTIFIYDSNITLNGNNNATAFNGRVRISGCNITVTSKNTANGLISLVGDSNIQSSNIKLYANTTMIAIIESPLENAIFHFGLSSSNITANGTNPIKLTMKNLIIRSNSHISSSTFNITNGLQVLIINASFLGFQNNNIILNQSIPFLNITNSNYTAITGNTIELTGSNSDYVVFITDSNNTSITRNYFKTSKYNGNYAVSVINSTGTVIGNNTPPGDILTNDNYDTYFTNGVFNNETIDSIELGSDLYNKNLTFNNKISIINPNNYTIYNGTISSTSILNLTDIKIVNTDDRKTSIYTEYYLYTNNVSIYQENKENNAEVIVFMNKPQVTGLTAPVVRNINITLYGNGTILYTNNSTVVSFNSTNVYAKGENITLTNSIQSTITYLYSNITIETNNSIIIDKAINQFNYNNLTVKGNNLTIANIENIASTVNYNNISVYGNNITVIKGTNTSVTTAYNNIYLEGDNLTAINIENKTTTTTMQLRNNNITIETNTPTTAIKYTNIQRITTQLNNILIKTNNNGTPIINVTDGIATNTFTNNYLESYDNYGVDAISVTGVATVNANNGPSGTFNTTIKTDTPNKIYINDTLTININTTDLLDRPINNGILEVTYNNQTTNITVNDSTATYIFTPTTTGTNNIIFTFTPTNTSYLATNKTVTIQVNKYNTTINASNVSGKINKTTTITPQIIDELLSNVTGGNITISDENGTILANSTVTNGTSNLNLKFNTTGNKTLVITYVGTDKYDESTINITTTITKLNTTITVDNVIGVVGESITLIAHIVDEQGDNVTSGRVQFKINGVTLRDANGSVIYVNVTNGVARLTLTAVRGWTNTGAYISANYAGNSVYLTSASKNSSVSIAKRNATVEIINDTRVYKAGDTITITAVVTDSNGQLATSGQVVFKLNGVTLKDRNGKTIMVNVVNGIATLTYTLPSTFADYNYTITAIFAGGDYNRQVGKNSTLQVIKTSIHMDLDPVITTTNTATIKAKIYDGNNKQITGTTRVTIKLNGVTIINSQNITNGNLQFTINTPYKTGLYNMTIIAGPSSVYEQLQRNTTLVIMKN